MENDKKMYLSDIIDLYKCLIEENDKYVDSVKGLRESFDFLYMSYKDSLLNLDGYSKYGNEINKLRSEDEEYEYYRPYNSNQDTNEKLRDNGFDENLYFKVSSSFMFVLNYLDDFSRIVEWMDSSASSNRDFYSEEFLCFLNSFKTKKCIDLRVLCDKCYRGGSKDKFCLDLFYGDFLSEQAIKDHLEGSFYR